jgi:hypothetical protein
MVMCQLIDKNKIEFAEYMKGLLHGPKYVVDQRYYNSGKVTAFIEERESIPEWMVVGRAIEYKTYDQYFDVFDTFEEAQKFQIDCMNA